LNRRPLLSFNLDDIKTTQTNSNLRPHSNVVQFFGVSEIPNLCIITEFLEEGSLDNLLKRENFDNRQFVGMATDIAAGMLHLHKEGIVHRDLATRNLLVKKIQRRVGVDYEVKVTDFGLSRKSMTGTTKADMPLKWSAPESLADGKKTYRNHYCKAKTHYYHFKQESTLSRVMSGHLVSCYGRFFTRETSRMQI